MTISKCMNWHIYNLVNNILYNNVTYKILDRGLIEFVGPQGLILTLTKLTKNISTLQSGIIYNYAFIIFISTTLLLLILNYQNYLNFELLIILIIFIYLLKQK